MLLHFFTTRMIHCQASFQVNMKINSKSVLDVFQLNTEGFIYHSGIKAMSTEVTLLACFSCFLSRFLSHHCNSLRYTEREDRAALTAPSGRLVLEMKITPSPEEQHNLFSVLIFTLDFVIGWWKEEDTAV